MVISKLRNDALIFNILEIEKKNYVKEKGIKIYVEKIKQKSCLILWFGTGKWKKTL